MSARLLDLYCCQGGAGMGYHRAGWDVYGVDNDKTNAKYYPFPIHIGNAITTLWALFAGLSIDFHHQDGTVECLTLSDFDAAHGSPPCQALTRGNAGRVTKHVNLIPQTRDGLRATRLPYVIENVEQAKAHLIDPVLLCGTMFGLTTWDEDGLPLSLTRHRLFETNWHLDAPEHSHQGIGRIAGVYGGGRARKPGQTAAEHRDACQYIRKGGYVPRDRDVKRRLLGIDWPTTVKALEESIPPQYAQFIGTQLLAHVREATV